MTPKLANLNEIASAVFRIPGLEWAMIHQHEELDEYKTVPVSGSPGAKHIAHRRLSEFRVVIRHAGKFHELRHADLRAALAGGFERTGIVLAEKIAELDGLRDSTLARLDAAPKATTDKQEEQRAKWLATIEGCQVSLVQLRALDAWMKER